MKIDHVARPDLLPSSRIAIDPKQEPKSMQNILNTFSNANYSLLIKQRLEQINNLRHQNTTIGIN